MIIEKEKISTRQLTLIMIGYILGDAMIFGPAIAYAGHHAWLSNIISILFGLLYFFLLSKFVKLMKGQSLVKYCLSLFGAFWGRIIILPLILYLFLDAGLVIKEMGLMISTYIYEETPLIFFSVTLVLTTAYGVKKGVEVIARNCEIIVPYLIFILLILLVPIMITVINYDNLKPFFPPSILPAVKGAIPLIGFPVLDSVFLLFLLPLINQSRSDRLFKGLATALFIGGGLLFFRPLVAVGAFGATEAANMPFPVFNAVRLIQFGDFVERLESVMLPIWLSSSYVKILILYYVTTVSFTEFFQLDNYQPFILPFGLILAAFSELVLSSIDQSVLIANIIWFPLSFIPSIIIPLLILISGKIKAARK